jgi:hypothetical protein
MRQTAFRQTATRLTPVRRWAILLRLIAASLPLPLEELAGGLEIPLELRQALHRLKRECSRTGLSNDHIRGRLEKLKELRILPENRKS